jgi:hypothetical protein
MNPAIPLTSNPANTYNPVENTGVFQRVLVVRGVRGLEEVQPDPWKAKLPPKCSQTQPAKTRPCLSTQPAIRSPLVPLESPWLDGQRYRPAGATELATRLDLFLADPAGPWIRRYGVLLSMRSNPEDIIVSCNHLL